MADDEIQVDHLECEEDNQHEEWVRTNVDDVQTVNLVQVLPVEIQGKWEFRRRQSVFHVLNIQEINDAFVAL